MSIWTSLSQNLLKWLLGVIAGLMVAGLMGGFKFYTDWKADEAAEDAEKEVLRTIMFDNPAQKEDHKDHVEEAPSPLEQRLKMERDADFQREILKEIREMKKLDTLNADQMYQIKEELKQIKQTHNN